MENQTDRQEQRLEKNSKAIEQWQRTQTDHIAKRRSQINTQGSEATIKQHQNTSYNSHALHKFNSERFEQPNKLIGRREESASRTPNEVAMIRTTQPSEIRRDVVEHRELIHQRNYREFIDSVAKGKLENSANSDSKMVRSDQIVPLSITEPELQVQSEMFWHHHGNEPDYYRKMGEAYPKLYEQLKNGRPREELANDREFKDIVAFWYGNPTIKIDQFKNSYFCDESGRHRVALAHRFRLEEIPAQVRKWRYKDNNIKPV
jgi:hypothetical protein